MYLETLYHPETQTGVYLGTIVASQWFATKKARQSVIRSVLSGKLLSGMMD
jgi:hypothetical protein